MGVGLLAGAVAAVPAAPQAAEPQPPAARAAVVKCVPLYSSRSIYRYGRVYVVRGTSCATAVRVARSYDNLSLAPSPWRCGLAHMDLPRLFSCGYPPRSPLTASAHAFYVLGVGRR